MEGSQERYCWRIAKLKGKWHDGSRGVGTWQCAMSLPHQTGKDHALKNARTVHTHGTGARISLSSRQGSVPTARIEVRSLLHEESNIPDPLSQFICSQAQSRGPFPYVGGGGRKRTLSRYHQNDFDRSENEWHLVGPLPIRFSTCADPDGAPSSGDPTYQPRDSLLLPLSLAQEPVGVAWAETVRRLHRMLPELRKQRWLERSHR
jgi:hypothetical protein